jgi:hypothetical protein
LREIFYEDLERYVKRGPVNGQLSPLGALSWKLEGVRLLGNFTEKENAYLGSFSWNQRESSTHNLPHFSSTSSSKIYAHF